MNTVLYQLELDQSIVNCGMSYVFVLDDGSFFIIDGGYFTPGEDDRLFSFLKEKAGGRPHIRGWFFSHAHQDHIGCFLDFIEKYHDEADIDTLYYNFQPTRHRFAVGSWKKKSNDLATVKHFYKTIKKYSDYFKIHTVKTDEKFSVNELNIEVLYTQENLYPVKASFNDYSAVISVSVQGQKILFLGDVGKSGSEYLIKNKKDKLKSDIVQMSHHGFNGADKDVYSAASPSVLLYPAPDYEFEKTDKNEVTEYVLGELNISEVFVSGYGDCELVLPYKIGTAVKREKIY